MSEGGEKNLFGTLYELLVFRQLAAQNLILSVNHDKGKEEVDVFFPANADLLGMIQAQAGAAANIEAQTGDADLVATGIEGMAFAQLKASLAPGTHPIQKSHLAKILVAAAKHWDSIVREGAGKPLKAFTLVTNRPLGKIASLTKDLKNFDLNQDIGEQLCPTVLGESPSCTKDEKNVQQVTVASWCRALAGKGKLEERLLPVVHDLLARFQFIYLPPEVSAAAFVNLMKRLGLNQTETTDVGKILLGDFISGEVKDVETASACLKRAIFDPPTRFHTLCPEVLRSIEAISWNNAWQACGFHVLDDLELVVPQDARLEDAAHAIAEVIGDDQKRGILISGLGGTGKTFLAFSIVRGISQEAGSLLIPCPDGSGNPRPLDRAVEPFFVGYRFTRSYPKWLERLQSAQQACGETGRLWLYLPNADELDARELKRLLQDISNVHGPDVKMIATARSEVWGNAVGSKDSGFVEVELTLFSAADLRMWLQRLGVDENGQPITSAGMFAGVGDLMNERLRRLSHPLLFSAIARRMEPLDRNGRVDLVSRYLKGDPVTEAMFWAECNTVIVERLHKHMGPLGANVGALRASFTDVFDHREQLPGFSPDEFNNKFFNTVEVSSRGKLRDQFVQVGIIAPTDASGRSVRWSLEGYDPPAEVQV